MADERVQKILEAKGKIDVELKKIPSAAAALPASISAIQGELTNIETAANSFGEVPDSARYLNHGTWAIHYSTVRMTVATFTVTACLTIMGLKWDGAKSSLVWATMILAMLGYTIFMTFSFHTVKMMNRQLKVRGSGKSVRWSKDVPTWILSVLFVLQLHFGFCNWLPEAMKRDAVSQDQSGGGSGTNSAPASPLASAPAVSNRPPNSSGTNSSQSPR